MDDIGWETTTDNTLDTVMVVRPHGLLTLAGYREFTDTLVKFALDEPSALVVLLDELGFGTDALFTAFSNAWMRIQNWPAVPLLLVAPAANLRMRLRASAVSRFVPVHPSVAAATAASRTTPPRRRAALELTAGADCAQRARLFVTDTCAGWALAVQVGEPARLVVTELVDNAVLHTATERIGLRLEWRPEKLAVAVSDTDSHLPLAHVPRADGPQRGYGLHLVAAATRAWGSTPRPGGGKVVWACLEAPAISPIPSKRSAPAWPRAHD
ncbi:ATP-binding protein [Nocardia yamanashiensis]|uniref:ATP-binding protein n=1 Tax=Nocardia yamanashiensis TaxID=209247 RepID=UPI002FCE1138